MLYPYTVKYYEANEHGFWIAESLTLKGCVGQGDTDSQAIKELQTNETDGYRPLANWIFQFLSVLLLPCLNTVGNLLFAFLPLRMRMQLRLPNLKVLV